MIQDQGVQAPPDRSRPRSRVTLQDVADRAGVSLTTASRVLGNGPRQVGQPLADRVHRAAADLGYTANLQARAVATGQSTMVGVVVHDIADPYFATIAAGLIEVADAQRLLVCISSTSATEAAEREYVALMRAQRARAVILIGSRTDDADARDALRAEIAAFTGSGGRAVCVGQDLLGVDTILPENTAGAQALAQAMVALGHRRFAVLAGPRGLLTARDRLDGFRAGLAAWSVPLDQAQVIHGPFSRDGGYEAMSAILAAGEPRPDCVFAVTDVMALGALARLRAGGLQVPADIALAGFDDIATLRAVHPPWARWPRASSCLRPTHGPATQPRTPPASSRSPARSFSATAPSRARPDPCGPARHQVPFRSIGKRLPRIAENRRLRGAHHVGDMRETSTDG